MSDVVASAADARSVPGTQWVVLDTNTALDIWWFDDARSRALGAAVAHGGYWRWAATPAMGEELAQVLRRHPFATDATRCGRCLAAFERLALIVDIQDGCVATASDRTLLCHDPDDQIFVELAWHLARAAGASVLVTRDRHLLALRRPLQRHGCRVLEPVQWRDAHNAPCGARWTCVMDVRDGSGG